ncbi:MAG: phytanoyl-CoA dioxygenase family protein [Sulfitobacter sp.]
MNDLSVLSRRILDDKTKTTFQRDGVELIKNVIPHDILPELRDVVDAELEKHAAKQFAFAQSGQVEFSGSQDMWRTNPTCEKVCMHSDLPDLASQLLGSQKVNLFFDHLFVKKPQSSYTTSWHNDIPYWPIKGRQVLSFWIALDDVKVETGALVFCLGSHRWGRFVQPSNFAHQDRHLSPAELLKATVPDLPDDAELKAFPMKAGDVLAFDALAVHCAGPNTQADAMRRGYAIRYAGDDVVYDPRPGVHKMMFEKTLTADGPIDCERYPVVFRTPDAAKPL